MNRLVRLTDASLCRLEPLLPPTGGRGRPGLAHRVMLEAMLWILRTGAPWRDLPRRVRLMEDGVHPVLAVVSTGCTEARFRQSGRRARWRRLHDRRHHRARSSGCFGRPKKAGEQAIGRSRGGPSTKLHAVVDALGNPTRMVLTPGQTHEMRVAEELLGGIHNAYVIADSAYSAKALVDALIARGCTVVIPANPTHMQRDYDAHLYKERHLVENFCKRIKRFRRIAMRFEKLAKNFLAFLFLAASLVWLL